MNNDLHKILSATRKASEQVNQELPKTPFYDNLVGMCLICGTAVKSALDQLNLSDDSTQFVHGLCCPTYAEAIPNHCWVEHQGHILDITATQFGQDFYDYFGRYPQKVEVLPIYEEAYQRSEVIPCSSIEEAYSWSVNVDWTTYQCPYPKLVQKILDKSGLIVV